MKVLITGATGLIGKELSYLLLKNDYVVHYLTTSKDKIVNSNNYFGFYWNPEKGIIDENSLLNVDTIIHLAGANIANRWTKDYKQEIIESRTLSAQLLFSTLKNNPNQVKHFISASGTAIYPESYTKVYDETCVETDNSFLADVVKIWEESANQFNLLDVKVSKIRTGVVFAKNGGALPQMAKPIELGFGAAIGNGKQVQSWIHLSDLIEIYKFILDNKLDGIYNAVAPQTVTNTELTKQIAKTLNKPLWLPNIPQFIMKLILGEMSSLLFSSKNLSSQKIQKVGFKFLFPTLKEALIDIYK